MRAQREKVKLLVEGGADPDDIMIARCKYQSQLNEYKAFSKKFSLPEQRERIYYDLKGRIAPSYRDYEYHKYDEQIIHEIHKAGITGKVHITPTNLDFSTLQYDKEHIIDERDHGVTEAKARAIIRTASVSATVWQGRYERYYSTQFHGAVYVDKETNTIRTAFIGEEVTGDAARVMEVLEKYGR